MIRFPDQFLKSYHPLLRLIYLVGVTALLVLLPPKAQAASKGAGNLLFEGAIGSPITSIENPDGTLANYNGLALQGRILIPLYTRGLFTGSLSGSLRYLDLKNSANSSSQKEFSNQLGPGAGLRFAFGKIFIGADYFILVDRHFSFGGISKEVTQTFSPTSFSVGYNVPLGSLSFGLTYTMSSGTIGTKETNLNQDSPYSDTQVMLQLTWDSGIGFGKFAGDLFKK